MELAKIIKELINTAQQIGTYYEIIANLETNCVDDSEEYEANFIAIMDLNNKEKSLLISLDDFFMCDIRKEVIKYRQVNDKVDYTEDASYYRINNMLDGICGDDLIDYSLILQNDINMLLLKFIDKLITDENYFELRPYLIKYKYQLIYLNFYTESDFLSDAIFMNANFQSNKFRTDDIPSYIFVDKSLLVLESKEAIVRILSNSSSYENSDEQEALMIIDIINVLARLTLCEQDTLNMIYDDLMGILTDETINKDLIELIKEMLNILDSIKNTISWSR